ncbi:MAG: hypothetical protein K9L70_05360 [Thiohalocapsa sp.]|nr:hypothetical protein [Thiohalocapsa sp.]MCF7991843.1 hypothetical protein [Thiohalocapsa sp.]
MLSLAAREPFTTAASSGLHDARRLGTGYSTRDRRYESGMTLGMPAFRGDSDTSAIRFADDPRRPQFAMMRALAAEPEPTQ